MGNRILDPRAAANGSWGSLKQATIESFALADLPVAEQARWSSASSTRAGIPGPRPTAGASRGRKVDLKSDVLALLLPAPAATGKLVAIQDAVPERTFEPLEWDAGGPWLLVFEGRDDQGDLALWLRLRAATTNGSSWPQSSRYRPASSGSPTVSPSSRRARPKAG